MIKLRSKPKANWAFVFAGISFALTPWLQAQDEDVFVLDPFTVQSSDDEGYRADSSNTATLINVERDRIPFITSVINETMISDLAIDNVADFSSMIAGMSIDTNPYIADELGQSANSYRIRGFQVTPLYNGFQIPKTSSPDNVGRVEVSKGPNSVLYGQSGGGGIVNLIPKAPRFDKAHAKTTVGAGNLDYRRAAFDLGGPLQAEDLGTMAVRFGASALDFEREQIWFENRSVSLYGAMSWILNDRVKLDVFVEYLDSEITPSRTAAFVSVGSGPDRVVDPYNRLRNDRNFSYNGPHSNNEFETSVVSSHLTLNPMDSITVRLGGVWMERNSDILRYVGAFGLGTSESAGSQYEKKDDFDTTQGFKIDLLHQTEIAGFSIDTILGYETYSQSSRNRQIRSERLVTTIPFDRKPVWTDFPAPPPPNEFGIMRTLEEGTTDASNLRFNQIIGTPDSKGTLLWGVAKGDGESTSTNLLTSSTGKIDGDATTYTAGATYRILETDEISLILFANLSTSFQIQSGNQQNPAIFEGFQTVEALREFVNNLTPQGADPEEGEGYEVGARISLQNGTWVGTLAYFDQSRTNIGRTFYVRESFVSGVDSEEVIGTFTLASGEENSSGIELNLDWNPNANWTLTLGSMFADGKVVSNVDVPEEVGLGLVRAPDTMVHAWARYRFDSNSALNGLSVGLGASYNSSTRIAPNFNDRFRLSDDYTDVQMMVRYRFELWNRSHSVSLNVRNLLDDEWVNEANWLSDPRLYRLQYSIDW